MKDLIQELKEYLKLNIDYARLTVTEKLTVMLTATALAALVALLCTLILIFLSIAAAGWLGECVGQGWAYLIVSGFYLIILVVVVAMRKKWIVDPIARFISKLIIK